MVPSTGGNLDVIGVASSQKRFSVLVGELEGDWLGELEGDWLGDLVGSRVGNIVGDIVGFRVGDLVGCEVGSRVGDLVGCVVGFLLGSFVGGAAIGGSLNSPLQVASQSKELQPSTISLLQL